MAMPDAVQCLLSLLEAPAEKMVQRIYNVTSFTIRAEEILERAKQAFGDVHVDFVVDEARQRIVNSWPTDMDDSAARKEWGWTPALSIDRTFSEYLIPGIRQRYEGSGLSNPCASSSLSCAL
jgi:nucleoside-diphosphate-sugar epimerase